MRTRRWLAFVLALLFCIPSVSVAQENQQYNADFEYLRYFAPNVAGWIYQPDTTIDSPVMHTDNRTFYLSHGFDGRNSATGAIYITSEDMPDLSARVVVLRGRNDMQNRLFGSLSEFREPEYYAKHPSLYLISPEGSYQLDIFAGLKTKHADQESWLVSPEEDLMARLPAILESSFLTADPALLPQADDAWAILTTEDAKNSGSRFVIYARKRPLPASDGPVVWLNQQGINASLSVSGYATAEGVDTWMVYGQNDPMWDRMVFEVAGSSRRRPFGDGGCGPTSIAMAIANLVPQSKLPRIREYAAHPLGYVFCPCGIDDRWCDLGHVPYQVSTEQDYLKYFPLVVGSFAMGNNTFGVQGRRDSYGTNMSYIREICSIYGISVKSVRTLEEALPYLRRKDTMAVSCVSGAYSPFTRNSHFLVLARVTNEYIYVLDPLRRETYGAQDPNGIVEILTPGLVRVRLENAAQCHFTGINLLTY